MITALYRPSEHEPGAKVQLLDHRAQYGRGIEWRVRVFGTLEPFWVKEWHLHEVTGVCAWCWSGLRRVGYTSGPLSHGICVRHLEQEMAKL